MSVHNHGPAEGRGLDCGENVIDGKLTGWCLRDANVDDGTCSALGSEVDA